MTNEQYDALVQKYLEDFRKKITEDIFSWSELDEFESESEPHCRYYLGFMPWPSAKFFAPWGNGTIEDLDQDEAWFEALEKRCDELVKQVTTLSYMSFEHGEDPCDLFLVWGVMEHES